MTPSTCSAQTNPGGQHEGENEVVTMFKENNIKERFGVVSFPIALKPSFGLVFIDPESSRLYIRHTLSF